MKHSEFMEECSWQECLADIQRVNPTLATLMIQSAINSSHEYKIIKVRYPYGAKIIHRGELHLPMKNGGLVPLSHLSIPDSLRKQLNYCFMPLGLVVSKMVEVYFATATRVVPEKLYQAGEVIGLWQLLDLANTKHDKHIWNMSAGARTVFMLPMISDNVSHARIRRELAINSYPPKTLLDQHDLFTEIVKRTAAENSWLCEILLFSREWFEHSDNLLWKSWLTEAWKQTYYCRRRMVFDPAQEAFSEAISRRNLKPKPYILNTFHHLIDIGRGIFPGFVAAGMSEQAVPTRLLQDAYVHYYLLKEYAPIIMHPYHLNAGNVYDKVYYSLSLPTLLNCGPRPGRMPSIMADLRELKLLFNLAHDYYKDELVDYTLFHTELDQFGEICHSQNLPQFDQNLSNYSSNYEKRTFPYTSSFLRGCVQIALKK